MDVVSTWAWFGTLYLLILAYQDIKNKMWVDDRYNYFMFGITLALTSVSHNKLWVILLELAVVVILSIILSRTKALGEADIKSITWIIFGAAIINPYNLLYFFSIFTIITLFYNGLAWVLGRLVKQRLKFVPFYPVFLLSFGAWCLLYGLY